MSKSQTIQSNHGQIMDRIKQSAENADRDPKRIKLVAVTKYVGCDEIRSLYDCGCRDFGESRPQVLWEKSSELADLDIRWHMIGQLQRNKAKRTLPCTSLIHSGESLKLLRHLDRLCDDQKIRRDVLLEINISGDETKHGFTSQSLKEALPEIDQLENMNVKGLMSMAARIGGSERARQDFQALAELQKELLEQQNEGLWNQIQFNELSIGMSNDFEVAIEEGATIVRVGSALFA